MNPIVAMRPRIGLPLIGAGLAGGDWAKIEQTIKNCLDNCADVVIVRYKP